MYAAKDSGGNPKSVEAHKKVDEGARMMAQATSDLTLTLEKAGGEAGLISGTYIVPCWLTLDVLLWRLAPPSLVGMVDEITKAMGRLDTTLEEDVQKTFTDYQGEAFAECKLVAKDAQEMLAKAATAPNELSAVSRELTTTYAQLVESTRGALATIESAEVGRWRYTAIHPCLSNYLSLILH